MRLHQRLQPFLQDLGVDLGGGDVGMAQEQLQAAQVGATAQQVAGEGMPQHMRADPFRLDPRRQRRILQQ